VNRPKSGNAIAWLALAFLLVAEFAVFDARTSRNYAWVYPRWNDQIQYLTEAYTGHEYASRHGIANGLVAASGKGSAQGLLDDLAAIVVFRVAGPSRSAALAVNMLAWAALQAAVFLAAWRVLRSQALAWVAVGLLLCWGTPLAGGPGSAVDFRLDFMAACAFGIALAAAASTDGFRSLHGSLAFGAAVGVTLLVRFLTGTYFALIFMGLAGWVLFLPSRWRRALNVFLSLLVAAAMAGPVFWINRKWIWDYYFIGHFTGPESAIRNPHMGVLRSLEFVIGGLLGNHLQAWFLGASAGITLILAAGALAGRPFAARAAAATPQSAPAFAPWLVPAALFALAPVVVLTLHSQKSAVVLSIIVPGAVALLLGLWAWLCRPLPTGPSPAIGARLLPFLAGLMLLLGACHFIARQAGSPYDETFIRDARRVNAVADRIFAMSRKAGLESPRIAVDQVTDSLDGQVMRVICYERHRVWVPFIMTLPTGIMSEREALLMERLAQSDFVFLAVGDAPAGGFPYDEQMRALRPKTKAWCDAHLRLLDRFNLFDRTWALYCRPELAN